MRKIHFFESHDSGSFPLRFSDFQILRYTHAMKKDYKTHSMIQIGGANILILCGSENSVVVKAKEDQKAPGTLEMEAQRFMTHQLR